MLALVPPVTCVAILAQSGYLRDGWLVWAVFATLMVNGIVGALQASRFGAGTMFISGTATGFLPVSVIALAHGGPMLLASLVVAASMFQFGIASWLPRLRRIITPVVSGLMVMLIAVATLPIVQDGLDVRKGLIVAVALALGVGLETRAVFAGLASGPWAALLNNGITVGALAAIAMTAFMELTDARTRRLRVDLAAGSMARLDDFLRDLAADRGWTGESGDRLRFVGEEAFQSLLRDDATGSRRLTVVARPGPGQVELEFLAALSEVNVEDEIAYLSEAAEAPDLNETSLRLLRHYATSVRHRKYHGVDVVSVRVEGLR